MNNAISRMSILCMLLFSIVVISCETPEEKPREIENEPEETEDNSDPFTSFFKNEVKPEESKPCFEGAYYRKFVSSEDKWLGIHGKVVLPEIIFDEERVNPAKPKQYLDNPSIYLGGKMGGQETDIGLTWEVIRDENGNVTADRRAFRPFLRRAPYRNTQKAVYENAPAERQYYWYPGEEVEMSVEVISDGKLKFIVEGAGKRYETEFESQGYTLNGTGEFKRVNAIDQVGNEGKPAQATNTIVKEAVWKETNLYREYEGKVVSVPIHGGRFTDMRCPAESYFDVASTEEEQKIGAETITISGQGN